MEKKRDHERDFKGPETPHFCFFRSHFVSRRKKGCWSMLKISCLGPVEWVLDHICLRFRPWWSKQSWQEEQIMWGSIKQPVPDSYTVESSSASKENPTCEDDGMMLSNIEIRQDTSNFLSATPCLPCIYALDTKFWQKKFIPTILSMLDTKSGPRPPKIRN